MDLDYINYELEVEVRIKNTGELGEAFERIGDCISVFIDGEKKCRFFHKDNVIFL